eukprot:5899542-Prymnesium_polylepis.1
MAVGFPSFERYRDSHRGLDRCSDPCALDVTPSATDARAAASPLRWRRGRRRWHSRRGGVWTVSWWIAARGVTARRT